MTSLSATTPAPICPRPPRWSSVTIFDGWFCGILGPTYPNRFYTHAAATDRISNTTTISTLPTIWEQLSAAGVPANYYFSDLPFIGLFGERMLPICRRIEHFYADADAGTLPAYSYLDPSSSARSKVGRTTTTPTPTFVGGKRS